MMFKAENARISPSPHRMMFDIGEPSQTSDKVIAMLDLNLDPLLNITSQHSSSIADTQTNHLANSGGQAPNHPSGDCKAGVNVVDYGHIN